MSDGPTPQQIAAFQAELRDTLFNRQSLLLADDLFLTAVDYHPGRVYGSLVVEQSTLGLGLAGAVICELLLAEVVWLDGDALTVMAHVRPADGLHAKVHGMVQAEPPHPVTDWVSWLGQTAVDLVAQRMLIAPPVKRYADPVPALLQSVEKKLLGGLRYHPTDYTLASWRAHRLAKMLTDQAATTWPDYLLLGLMQAVGLTSHVLRMTEQDVSAYLTSVDRTITTQPALACVVAAVAEHVSQRALSGRN